MLNSTSNQLNRTQKCIHKKIDGDNNPVREDERTFWHEQEQEPLLVQPEHTSNVVEGNSKEENCRKENAQQEHSEMRVRNEANDIKKKRALSKFSWASLNSKRRKKQDEFKSASFLEMLRYADRWDWLMLVVGIFTNVAAGALNPASSLIFRGITDVLMNGQHQMDNGTLDMEQFSEGMVYHVWLYVILGIITFVNVKLSMATLSTVCERQVHRIRRHLFKAILAQEPGWFDRPANQVGALTHKMASGIDRIREGMSDKIGLILQAISSCVAGIIYGFWMSWRMTLVMIVVSPFLVISFVGSAATVSRLVRKEMSAYSAAGAVAEEVLSGIRTVSAFNAQYFELGRYKQHLDTGRKTGIRKGLWVAFFGALHLLFMFGSMGIAFWYGTSLVLQGTITPGTVFAVFWSVLIGAMTIGRALPQMGVIVGAKMAAGEMLAIIDRKPALDATGPVGMRPERVQGRIEFTNVHFAYPTRPTQKVLKDVSFCVEPSQSIALVGHSGCGKSTMVGLMMRFYDAQRGSVTLDGLPLRDLNVQWLRQTVALVQQEPVLFADTVEENLRMGNPDATTEEMVAACRMANAHDFICKLPEGYRTRIGQGGIQLSGGQKQRLAIARALVRNPRILLLDEATSALDAESEQLVQEALERASSGRTTVTIAHRLSTVRNADRILVFEHGQIVEDGNHEQLMAKPDSLYRQLVLAQQIAGSQQPDVAVDDASDDEPAAAASRGAKIIRAGHERESETKMMRASERMRRSMTSVKSAGLGSVEGVDELEELDQELQEMEARPASFWDILCYARPERTLVVLGVLIALGRGVSWPLFSVIYGRLFLILSNALGVDPASISAAERDEYSHHLFVMNILNSLAFAGLGVWGALTTFASGSLLCTVGERMTQRLRLDVFKNILAQDGYFFDDHRHSAGKLCQRLATDAPNVQAAIDQRLAEVLQGVVSLVAGISVAFYFGWNVAPIGLVTALILVGLETSVSNYLKRRGMRDMLLAEDASRVATESIEYVRTVQALNRQGAVYQMFCDSSAKPHRMAIFRGLLTSLSFAITGSFVPFNFGLTYFLGLLLIRGGFTTPFVLFQVVEALNMASFTIMAAAAYFPEYLRAKLSAGLMFTMARVRPRIDSLSEAGLVTPIQGSIDANSIYFAYPNGQKHLALNGLSLNVPSGKTVALVGPSGCGKSTMIQLLERYYDPMSGCLSIDGMDIRRYNLRHLRKAMALVGQEPTLFALSIRENIAYGLSEDEMDEQRIQAAAKLANIHAFVESLPQKYETPVGSRGTQLSGGQKQRIAIARAIVRDPRILLLDEATSALDTESEKVVQEALDRAKEGRTCIVIAHRLSTVQNADLIVVIRDGRVAELGSHQQLLQRKGLYYRLVQRQQMGDGSEESS